MKVTLLLGAADLGCSTHDASKTQASCLSETAELQLDNETSADQLVLASGGKNATEFFAPAGKVTTQIVSAGNITLSDAADPKDPGFGPDQVTLPCGAITLVTLDAPFRVTVTFAGTGEGSVASEPEGIFCGPGQAASGCSASFPFQTHVVLSASVGNGNVFVGWSGACSGSSSTCDVVAPPSATVTARFDQQ